MSAARPAAITIDPGPRRPPTRAELLSLVQRLTAEVKKVTTPLGWHYRKPLVTEATAALDAARRFGQLVLVAVAVLLGGAACASAQTARAAQAPQVDEATCTPFIGQWSNQDAEGRLQVELRLPGQPWRDVAGPRSETYCLSQRLPLHGRITAVRTFVAVDRGHRAEIDLKVAVDGYQLVTRSEHHETDSIYDAWKREPVQYVISPPPDGLSRPLVVVASGWPTLHYPDGAMVPVNIEVGVIVEITCAGACMGEARGR